MLKFNVSNLKAVVSLAKTTVIKYSPEILMGVGAVSFVGTVVAASKAAVKSQDILEDHKLELETIEEFAENEEYEIDVKKERFIVYRNTGFSLAKEYAPATACAAISLSCFFGAFGILHKRYTTLAVAYSALEESFRLYRQRVIEDKGEEADLYYLTGAKPKEITVKDEEGKKTKVKQLILPDGSVASPYAFKFGKYREDGTENEQWRDDVILNRAFVLGQQRWFNVQLAERCVLNSDNDVIVRGSVFLNEVRTTCGEGPTEAGSVAGWRFSQGEPGCNGYIDFRIIEAMEEDPVTGDKIPCIFVNPNCDGLIFDLIGKKESVPLPWHNDNIWGEDDII